MKQEVTLQQAKGKTIKDHCFSRINQQVIITFTDDTFTTLEGGDETVGMEQRDLSVNSFGDTQLIDLGIATKEELEQTRKVQRDKHAALKETIERNSYERLKRKYDG